MSLTSYRAAPPRAKIVCSGRRAGFTALAYLAMAPPLEKTPVRLKFRYLRHKVLAMDERVAHAFGSNWTAAGALYQVARE